MTDEYLLVQDLLKKYNISISQVAARCGMADSTLYEYTGGRRKYIPLCVWRALFELTEDIRILELVTGIVETFVVPVPKKCDSQFDGETLKNLIEKRKKDIECETAILDILADGKIDHNDWQAIEHYKKAYPEALKLAAQIYYTIIKKFENGEKKIEVS